MNKILYFLLFIIFQSTGVAQVDAQNKVDNEIIEKANPIRFEILANKLRCPTCQGLSVLDSTAPFSNQIKDIVRDQMNLGKTDQEILDFFSAKYGFWILREPPKEGFSLFAWLFPLLLLILGPLLLWAIYWRSSEQSSVLGNRSEEDILNQMKIELDLLRKKKELVS